jgi:hypothetical protein
MMGEQNILNILGHLLDGAHLTVTQRIDSGCQDRYGFQIISSDGSDVIEFSAVINKAPYRQYGFSPIYNVRFNGVECKEATDNG